MAGQIATARWADPDYIVDRYYFRPGDIWVGRNPHNFHQAVGYRDDRHILVCAGSRSGKGRSFIVNNLALWPGSTVVYDPKGELPAILAARRGKGDHRCKGMEQDVFVLDPLNHADVDQAYRAYFDPLSGLDPEDRDGELATWAKRIADSLIQYSDGTEASEWAKRAVRFTALIIMHVVTSPLIPDDKRNLITVLHYVLEGAEDVVDEMRERVTPEFHDRLPDPMVVLLDQMIENEACRSWITKEARNLKRQADLTPKFFESVRGEAADKLDWFKSAGIERTITGGLNGVPELRSSRQFDPKRLKTDPHGISVFIVMPVDDLKTYGPWLQAVFTGIFAAIRQVRGKPESGHQILTVLDEFSSLGHQEYIASSLDNIAGAGMKLAIILQNFGKLKKLYGDEMESFFSNAGLEIYFGKVGQTATEYVTKELGETEVVKLVRNASTSRSESQTASQALAYGETEGEGSSHSTTDSQSSARSRGRAWNWSNATNWSDTSNWGKSEGRSMGRNYGPHIFFEGFEHSNNYGTSLNNNRGSAHTSGGSDVKGGSRSDQFTDTQGKSETIGSSWNRSTTTTRTFSESQTQGYQIGSGIAETFHKKPLLEAHELNSYLRPLSEEDIDHPAFPGLALVRIQGEAPFFVRRSNYDQDPYFERCFSSDPVHGFIPFDQQPMLGYQYTYEHLFDFALPAPLRQAGYTGKPLVRRFQWVNEHTEIFSLTGQFSQRGAQSVRPEMSNKGDIIRIEMPELYPAMKAGKITDWRVKEGDRVSPGDVIADIQTHQGQMELKTNDHGIVFSLIAAKGREKVVGQLIAKLKIDGKTTETTLPVPTSNCALTFRPPCRGRVVGLTQDANNPRITLRLDHIIDADAYLKTSFISHIERVNAANEMVRREKQAALEYEQQRIRNAWSAHASRCEYTYLTPLENLWKAINKMASSAGGGMFAGFLFYLGTVYLFGKLGDDINITIKSYPTWFKICLGISFFIGARVGYKEYSEERSSIVKDINSDYLKIKKEFGEKPSDINIKKISPDHRI